MTTKSTSQARRFAKGALLVSAAFPISALVIAGSAQAEQTVEVNGTETAVSVQAKIDAAKATPDRDVTISVTSKGEVTGPGTIGITPVAGQGDGAIGFSNAGSLGAVDATGAVTDNVGVVFNGSASKADNTLAASNAGLITGGFSATGFGGTVSLDNSGTIHNGVALAGKGDVSLTSSGAVRSGDVLVAAVGSQATTVAGDTTTNAFTGGDATATVANVASADGKTKGNATFYAEYGNVDATVSGTAGNIVGYSKGVRTIQDTFVGAPPAGKTTVTSDYSDTYDATSVKIATTSASAVGDIVGAANGDVAVAVAGGVENNVQAVSLGNGNYAAQTTVTLDDKGGLLEQVQTSSGSAVAADSTIDIAATGKVGGFAYAQATRDASITNAGEVAGGLNAIAGSGPLTASNSSTRTEDGVGGLLKDVSANSLTSAIGSASVTVADTGVVGGAISASGTKDATVANAGTVAGAVTANAGTGNATTSSQEQVFDGKGNILSNATTSTSTRTAGNASIDIAETGKVGANVLATASNNASVVNAGAVEGSVTVDAGTGGSAYANERLVSYDGKGSQIGDVYSESSTHFAGNAAVDIAATGSVAGAINASARENVTIANAGVVGGGINASSSGTDSTYSYTSQTPVPVTDAKTGVTTSTTSTTSASTSTSTTGKVDFSNAAGAIVGFNGVGNVNLTAGGDITIINEGDVRGSTYAQSSGTKYVSSSADSTTAVDDGKGGGSFTEQQSGSETYTSTGGNVTGTYAGANGTLNFDDSPALGNVTQVADRASTVTVSGAVFGNVSSTAGNAGSASSSSKYSSSETSVFDIDGNGSFAAEYANSSETTAISGGDSTVTVSGRVARSNAGGTANVVSNGANSSTVVISGSVEDSVFSTASGATATTSEAASSIAKTVVEGNPVTDQLTAKSSRTSVVTDGASSVSITGKATPSQKSVGGSVSVSGVKSASADVASKAVVGGSLFVSSNNGDDYQSSTEQNYVRNAETGIATATEVASYTNGAAAAQGNASATVAGTVEGGTFVNAGRGDATVTLTGVSADSVSAVAAGSVVKVDTERTWTGKSDSSSGSFSSLYGSLSDRTFEETETTQSTVLGGNASVLVDTAEALKDKAVAATDDVYASGTSGASVTVTKGSIVTGDVDAKSADANTVRTKTRSEDSKGNVNLTGSTTTTIVGGPATVTNAGEIGDDVWTYSATAATVDNTGRIGGDVEASAIVVEYNSVSETTNANKAALRATTETFTPVVALGKASVTNAAGAIIGGDIYVEAGEGTVTNNGTVGGTTFLGGSVNSATYTEVRTDTTTDISYTPAEALLSQTYTANQNGVSGGFVVTGALDGNQTGEGRIKTSDVTATINLNSGSATLGSIIGEVDEDGNRTTNTTVNLIGSGFLGADELLYPGQTFPVGSAKPNPVLSLGEDAQNVFGGYDYPVRVLGVETLNKEGAGTFVISGAAYQEALPGGDPVYTLDIGNFNIKAGEVQLTTDGAEFGVKGNINNAATLVLGRRITPGQNLFGNNLVGQSEVIDGVTVHQVGDFNQSAAGTTVVGITPTLIRVYNTEVSDGSVLPEPLGPVAGGVYVGYFTTPEALGYDADNSRVDITGNLNLAGTVAVNVYRDSLYANGDGYTLFTYTGTGNVTADAAPTLTSRFVGFDLVHDEATKEVRLEVKRSSYTAGATNPNAQAAAAGLDSALASAITRIRTDAAGGAGFSSVTELGYAQDIANVATALDFRLTGDQAAQLFDELSSGEVYGSLAAVDQNGVFGQTLDMLTNRRSFGGELGTQLWLNPVGRWGKYGDGDAFGASDIRANSYGLAGGLDFAYAPDGAFGFGGAYAEHDIAARGTPEAVDGRTWTVGAYVTQGFGPIYANAKVAFGWTNYDVTRTMSLLARTAEASVNAKQLDASLEVGYDYRAGSLTVTPYGKLVLRRSSLEGFTETGAGAFSLDVDGRKKTVFSPVVGVKVGTETELSDTVTLRPFARASYTFQGNLPNDVSVRYVGGGDSFVLRGVEPDSFGAVEAGVEAKMAERLNLFFSGSQTFGGDNKVTGLRGGVTFQF